MWSSINTSCSSVGTANCIDKLRISTRVYQGMSAAFVNKVIQAVLQFDLKCHTLSKAKRKCVEFLSNLLLVIKSLRGLTLVESYIEGAIASC